jgi:hypothetical protein
MAKWIFNQGKCIEMSYEEHLIEKYEDILLKSVQVLLKIFVKINI